LLPRGRNTAHGTLADSSTRLPGSILSSSCAPSVLTPFITDAKQAWTLHLAPFTWKKQWVLLTRCPTAAAQRHVTHQPRSAVRLPNFTHHLSCRRRLEEHDTGVKTQGLPEPPPHMGSWITTLLNVAHLNTTPRCHTRVAWQAASSTSLPCRPHGASLLPPPALCLSRDFSSPHCPHHHTSIASMFHSSACPPATPPFQPPPCTACCLPTLTYSYYLPMARIHAFTADRTNS